MKHIKSVLIKSMIKYFQDDDRRINHALEVMKYSEEIIKQKSGYDLDIVIACALLHDVGIKKSEEIHGYNNGKTQEEYGPSIANDLLNSISFPEEKIEKVCQIIGNHHSKSRYDYIELEILKEADKIVNKMEAQNDN